MLERLGQRVIRHRRGVLAATVGLVLCAGILGHGVAQRLVSEGFDDPGSPSARAAALLKTRFAAGEPNFALVVSARNRVSVDDAAVRRAATALTAQVSREQHVRQVVSYWASGQASSLRSADGRSGLILAQLVGSDSDVNRYAGELEPRYRGVRGVLSVEVAGSATVHHDIQSTLERDLRRAEMYALPLTLLLLLIVFGSAVAAVLPLVIGGVAVVGTLLVLRLLTAVTDVSVFALNITTAIGLGLAIDYSLLIVTRFREYQASGLDPQAAAVRTMSTAGRTVLYSGATVGLSLAAMLLFPQPFLRSMALAGISVVALSSAAAIVVLPALLATIGKHLSRGTVRRRPETPGQAGKTWGRIAILVMRRPLIIAAVAVTFLIALGLPFRDAQVALSDDRVLPASAPSRAGSELLRTGFRAQEQDALFIVSTGTADSDAVRRYTAALTRIPGVRRVDHAPTRTGLRVSVVPAVPTYSPAAERIVRDVRAAPSPVPVLVGGPAAELVDTKTAIASRLPFALGFIAAAVGLLLFLFTGGLLVPIKAVLLNLLSLSATFGVMVWGFQEGNLNPPLNFTVTGTLDVATPVLMFCVAFGLSMDYEVFVLSRIHEEWRRTRNNTQAVALGLAHTGGLVTAGALLMSIVFLAIATSGVTTLQMMGVGLALAVLMDAAIVRTVLVPALMRLAGNGNWWAPTPLRRLHARYGLREAPDTEAPDTATPPPSGVAPQPSIGPAPAVAASDAPVLRYSDPSGHEHLAELAAASRLSIGRSAAVDIGLRWDTEVSRLHAELERIGEDWFLVDDGLSRNGTYVNQNRLAGRRRLRNGDELLLGSTTLVFQTPARSGHRATKEPLGTFLLYQDLNGNRHVADLTDTRQVSIGRHSHSEVCLRWDREASRLHAELSRVGEDWILTDDSLSRNGTYLNGERISGRRRLRDGDHFVIGATAITYHSTGISSLTTVNQSLIPAR